MRNLSFRYNNNKKNILIKKEKNTTICDEEKGKKNLHERFCSDYY